MLSKVENLSLCTFLQYYQRITCYLHNIKSLQNLVYHSDLKYVSRDLVTVAYTVQN